MEPGGAKVIISRDVVFDETRCYKNLLRGEPDIQAPPKDKGVEIVVERAVEKPNEEDDALLEEEDNLRHYQLVQDREKMEMRPPTGLGFAYMMACAFISTASVEEDKPTRFHEAMNEKMDSFIKNDTWTLVERPKG